MATLLNKTFKSYSVSPLAATAVACSIVGAFLLWNQTKKNRRREQNNNDDDDETIVELLPIERTLALGAGGDNAMSNLTWFKGDYRQAANVLQSQAEQILQANPWLGGRVVKRKGTPVLVYNNNNHGSTPSLTLKLDEEYFQILENDDKMISISRNVPLDQLGAKLGAILLKDGPTQPLWRTLIIPCSKHPTSVFAVVFSLSHIIGDGATFYKLQNMLLMAEPVESLIVQRHFATHDEQIRAMGGKREYSVLQSAGFIVNCVAGVLKTILIGPKAESLFFLIDPKGMETAKRQAAEQDGQVPFVSSNDVLTSWFCQNSSCKHGMMAMNFRGRLEGHTNHHAGNYENVIFYQRQDSATPGLIRKSVKTFRRVVTSNDASALSFRQLATGSVAMASNWSSFAKASAIPECEEDIQLPLYDIAALLPSAMVLMLIFRAGPQGLGIVVSGSPDKLKDLQDAPFLSQQILH